MNFDIPAQRENTTDSEKLDIMIELLTGIAKASEPGVRGIEGAENVPELNIESHTIAPGGSLMITGNRRRKTLYINATNADVFISTSKTWNERRSTPCGDSALDGLTNSIYVHNRAATAETVSYIEVSS